MLLLPLLFLSCNVKVYKRKYFRGYYISSQKKNTSYALKKNDLSSIIIKNHPKISLFHFEDSTNFLNEDNQLLAYEKTELKEISNIINGKLNLNNIKNEIFTQHKIVSHLNNSKINSKVSPVSNIKGKIIEEDEKERKLLKKANLALILSILGILFGGLLLIIPAKIIAEKVINKLDEKNNDDGNFYDPLLQNVNTKRDRDSISKSRRNLIYKRANLAHLIAIIGFGIHMTLTIIFVLLAILVSL